MEASDDNEDNEEGKYKNKDEKKKVLVAKYVALTRSITSMTYRWSIQYVKGLTSQWQGQHIT